MKSLVVIPAVSSVLIASVALACGGARPLPTPGYTGTTVAERGGTVSMFVGNAQGYLWQRVTLSDMQTQTIGQIPGRFSGSVETDSRVNTGIAGVDGKVVSIAASTIAPLSDDPGAQVDVFGAALSKDDSWNVFTYDATQQTIFYFHEANPGRFDKVGSLKADCGPVLMLDIAVESDGTIEGLCGPVAFEVAGGKMQTATLPLEAKSLSLGTDGKAIAFGTNTEQGGLQLMRHDTTGWTSGSTVGTGAAKVVFALDGQSVLIRDEAGYRAFTESDGVWHASAPLDSTVALTSVGGHPANVFSGSYDLTVFSTDGSENGAWTSKSLGALGEQPQAGGPGGAGCSIIGTAIPFALLGLMSMTRFRRRFAKAEAR
ncbi:MAG: hypothetical protein QM723_06250 [Myxococcaceae bacterium]